jgi:hypothetical protein
MPQSLSVFAVSLQEHPELLINIMPLPRRNVNGYYCLSDNSFGAGTPTVEGNILSLFRVSIFLSGRPDARGLFKWKIDEGGTKVI